MRHYAWKKKKGRMSARDEIAVEVLNGLEKPKEETKREEPPPKTCCSADTLTYLNIALFAIFGCLIRIGVDRLFGSHFANIESPTSVITQSFFSNMVGSFILGLLVASALKKVPGMVPVYTGISTGLCGSITTYSKWNQQVSTLMIGEANSASTDQVVALASIAVGLASALCSFEVGKDVSAGIRKRISANRQGRRRRSSSPAVCFSVLTPLLLIASWVALVVLAIVYSSQQTVITICLCGVFAPFGAILRFLLSRFNTSPPSCLSCCHVMKLFPFGTFLANFIGATVIAAMHVVLVWAPLSCVGIASIKAIQSGFLACLTTVSTFMSEISNLRGKGETLAAHVYAFLTILLCQLIGATINGSSYRIYLNTMPEARNLTCP